MQVANYLYTDRWNRSLDRSMDSEKTLVILFGPRKEGAWTAALNDVVNAFGKSAVIGASGAGGIYQDTLYPEAVSVAVIRFARTHLRLVSQAVASPKYSYENGMFIGQMLSDERLKGVFVLSEGLNVNGSQLTKGLGAALPEGVVVTGGLAGDDARFERTWVIADGEMRSNYIVAVGFYGEHFHVGYGSKGGWDRLGVSREVTRARENVLYELDGQAALEIYKRYLGDRAAGLPAAGLLFPLELDESGDGGERKVRTIVAVDEQEGSITLAGDLTEGSFVSLMMANSDRLVDGASRAAEAVDLRAYAGGPLLCIAVSCVGRRLVLKQRTEDELEAVLESLPAETRQVGFYSYGEISPLASGVCDLHNQTMTLTLIWETDAPAA